MRIGSGVSFPSSQFLYFLGSSNLRQLHIPQQPNMTITSEVKNQFFDKSTNKVINLPRSTYPGVSIATAGSPPAISPASGGNSSTNGTPWTEDEHARFLQGLELFPSGPWKVIANCVGTRTPRQVMSHAQKYRQKIARQTRQAEHQDGASSEINDRDTRTSNEVNDQTNRKWTDSSAMSESLSEMQMSSEILDDILLSLFEDADESMLLTQEEMDAILATQ
jgi:SHAQKYF class myb-like DNA-binding protein